MANLQPRPNVLLRILRWFGHHKVTSVFVVLILGVGIFLGISELMLQAQIRDERGRFMHAQKVLYGIADNIPADGNPKITKSSSCSYTDDGAVFATKSIGCDTGFDVVYADLSLQDAKQWVDQARDILNRIGLVLRENPGGYYKNNIAVFVFDIAETGCVESAIYYGDETPSYERYDNAPQEGRGLLIDVSCGGAAKAEYFPVAEN